jgi:hypothetical protein
MKKTLLLSLIAVASISFADAQTVPEKPQQKAPQSADSTKRMPGAGFSIPGAKAAPKPYATVITSKAVSRKGMITTHRVEDKYFFEIADSTLGRDILVVSRISKAGAEVRSASGYAGDQIGSSVIRFEKGPNNKIFMRKLSFKTYNPDSTTSMYRSLQNSNIQAIAAAFNVAAYTTDKKGSVIDMTDYLNTDNDIFYFGSPRSKTALKLGSQLSDRSYINSIRSFSQNVEINAVKTYTISAGSSLFGSASPSMGSGGPTGSTTLELNTSLVILPKVPMKARYFDARVGYFTVGYTDFDMNPQGVKELEIIKRWRLEPKAADMNKYKRGELVEPKKPIVFYIDPATPKKWVPYLMAGVNDWKKAFEKAGFKNAILAKVAPTSKEDSTWSLDDATHSAIVYKPSEISNASGPSIADPRSGEIMESHINWYHNVMKLVHDWYMVQAAAVDPRARKMAFSDELMGDLIRFVSSHEVGHTLGLRHNFGSSSTVPVEKLRDKAFVEANGHTPSIMDYARFNYVAQPEDHISSKGIYPRIGDYDNWAIEWGYKLLPEAKSPAAEVAILNKVSVERLKNKRLWFGTESNPSDPRSQSEDLGDNAMLASTYGIKNLKVILNKLPEWTKSPNEGYEDLNTMYGQIVTQFGRYMGHVTKYVGGVYETPKTVEQSGTVYQRTPANLQREAVSFLDENLFKTPRWLLVPTILDNTEGDPIELINKVQTPVLTKLLSSAVLNRLISAEAADGSSAYKITDLYSDLQGVIFSELKSNVEIDVYRRNLQKAYVEKLIKILDPAPASPMSALTAPMRGMATEISAANSDVLSVTKAQLRDLSTVIKGSIAQSKGLSKYHLQDLSERIDFALNPKSK